MAQNQHTTMIQILEDPAVLYGRLIPGYQFTLHWDGTNAVLSDPWSAPEILDATPQARTQDTEMACHMAAVTNEILAQSRDAATFFVAQDGHKVGVYLERTEALPWLVTWTD